MNRHDLIYSVYSEKQQPHIQSQPILQQQVVVVQPAQQQVVEELPSRDWQAYFQAIQDKTDRNIERYNEDCARKEAHDDAVTNLFYDAIGLAIALKLTKF